MPDRKHKKSESPIVIYGKWYPSISDAIEKLKPDVAEVTIRARKRYGWTPEQMFGYEKRDKRKEKKDTKEKRERVIQDEEIVVNGVKYSSIREACDDHDIKPSVVYNRLSQNKNKPPEKQWTIESAITTPVKVRSVVINGVKYRSANDAFNKIGKVSFTTYQGRREMGKRLEVCLGLEDDE